MKEKGSISRVEASLPPGFRFHPRDDELVCDYLMNKITNPAYHHHFAMLIQVDLNKCEPWDLPQNACVGGKDWYFYSQRDRKYATGLRTNRATATGYWKATGKDRAILRKGSLVGMRKTLVFYQGRAPKGKKTDWVMHEFRLQEPSVPTRDSSSSPPFKQEDWVLCRVFHKNKEDGTAKQGSGGGACSDDTTASSSLPPLMDSQITFEQPENNNIQDPVFLHENTSQHQQVPCFSISSHTQVTGPALTGSAGVASGLGLDYSFSSDQMVLRALLSQLTKVGERSTESLSSEVGMPLSGTSWLH